MGQDRVRSRANAATEPNVANNLARFRRWSKRLAEAVAGRKRTEITIETQVILTIRRNGCARLWCQECGCEVDVVQAQVLGGMAQPTLGEGSETNKTNCLEAPDGTLLVCLESLRKAM
jgi:hypothetical protein